MEPGKYYFMVDLADKDPKKIREGSENFVVSIYSECDVSIEGDDQKSY